MQEQIFAVGARADKLCENCREERGHIVTAVTKRGQISRVSCPKCGTVSTFKRSARTSPRQSSKTASPYDRTCTYRAGQTMAHETFGIGEVTKLIEPRRDRHAEIDDVRSEIQTAGLSSLSVITLKLPQFED